MVRYVAQQAFLGEKEVELRQKKVCIVGVGALGSVSAELLARAGVGELVLIDHDIVELSNLQRQLLYDEADVGTLKAHAAKEKLHKINSEVKITAKALHLSEKNVAELKADLVLDCTDNFRTRRVINDYCKEKNVPWIFCSATGSKGQILVVDEDWKFNSVFGSVKQGLTCESEGILNTASVMAASIQVTEAIKMMLGENYSKDLIIFDVWNNNFEKIKIIKKNIEIKKEEHKDFLYNIRLCKTRSRIKVSPNQDMSLDLERIKKKYDVIVDTLILIIIEIGDQRVLVYEFGELDFYETQDEEKIKKLADEIYYLTKTKH